MKVGTLAFAWVAFAGVGCSSLSSLSPFDNTSPAPLHATLAMAPAAPGGLAFQNSALLIQLDAYPDPATVSFNNITLRSAGLAFDANLRVDLIGKTIILTPTHALVAQSTYELLVSTDVRSLDHRALPTAAAFTFVVADGDGTPTPSPSPLTWANDIGPTLSTCSPYCHSPVDISGNPQAPTRSLDLTGNYRDPQFGLFNVESQGQAAIGVPMLRVSPGDSANSVLLRKLLGGEPAPGRTTAPYPEMGIVGQRMPLDLSSMFSAKPLDPSFIALVEQWIDEGAQ